MTGGTGVTNPGGSDPTEDADRVSSGGSEPIGPSRRRFVRTLTGGGSLLLAGCGELGPVPPSDSGPSGTPTATGNGGTENAPKTYARTFRAPTRHDPSKTAFYGWGHAGVLRNSAYAMVAMEPAGWSLRRFVRQPGVWTSGWQTPGRRTKIRYNWIEDPIQISPTEVRITVRPGATWSDGEPITGTDLAVLPVGQTLNRFFSPPAYAPGAEGPPHQVGFAFDDFEVGDRSVSYRSSTGAFDEFWDHQIAFRLGPVYPAPPPTHVEPFDAYAEAVLETARRAQAGEIFPWYTRGFGDPDRADLVEEHLGDPAYVRKFSKPEHVLATGPWDLTGTNGQEFVFEPTPTHPLSDAIDFERFVFEYTPSANRQRAALRADRFDFASARGGSPTPQTVIDSLPDTLEYLRVPSNSLGNELGVDHSHPVLGSRTVRSAIMHALDHATIAENIHRSVAVPVTTPGGDSWGATDVASRSWLKDTLTTYPTDRDTGPR